MPIRCVAIDDEPLALQVINAYAARMPQLQLLKSFDDAIEAMSFIKENKVDLLFVDINMPDINGLELVASLHPRPMVVFTTAHKKFAFDAFELDAIDYLLKPIDFDRFSKALQKAVDFYQQKNNIPKLEPKTIFVRSEYKLIQIELDEVVYLEGLEDYVKIHFVHARPILTLTTMKAMLEKLPDGGFIRIHRSYIIAVAKVKSVQNKKVLLTTATELPISDSYKEALLLLMKNK